jgi:hypothetical protein
MRAGDATADSLAAQRTRIRIGPKNDEKATEIAAAG